MSFTTKGKIESLLSYFYATIEEITNGQAVISTDHKSIHDGNGFCLHAFHTSLVYGAKVIYRYVSPLTKYAHIKGIQISSENATIIATLKRNVTITSSGTEVSGAINNLNDNSIVLPESKVYNGAVTYTGGTEWCSTIIHGSATNQSSSSGQFVQLDYLEYITKSNGTNYIVEIENIDEDEDTANNIQVNMFFYEEEQGQS